MLLAKRTERNHGTADFPIFILDSLETMYQEKMTEISSDLSMTEIEYNSEMIQVQARTYKKLMMGEWVFMVEVDLIRENGC